MVFASLWTTSMGFQWSQVGPHISKQATSQGLSDLGQWWNEIPVNRWGNLIGRMTASFSASLAPSKPATSSHLMFGFSIIIAPSEITDFQIWWYNVGANLLLQILRYDSPLVGIIFFCITIFIFHHDVTRASLQCHSISLIMALCIYIYTFLPRTPRTPPLTWELVLKLFFLWIFTFITIIPGHTGTHIW